jgi:hypothetical protein
MVFAVPLLAEQQSLPAGIPHRVTGPPGSGDSYFYSFFFRRVSRIHEEVEEARQAGVKSDYLQQYLSKKTSLRPSQAAQVDATAIELKAQLAAYDAHAKELKTKRHVLFQQLRLQNLPIPPANVEIKSLSAGRVALILRARDRLRANLGEEDFGRLDVFVKSRMLGGQLSTVAAERVNVSARPSPTEADRNRLRYRALLRAVVRFKKDAEKERALGLPKIADSLLTEVQRLAQLSDEEARTLDEIAADYTQKLAESEAKAKEARRQYHKLRLEMFAQNGHIKESEKLEAARNTLKMLRRETDGLTDNSIAQLQTRFGATEFTRFDEFVRRPIKTLPSQQHKAEGAKGRVPQEVSR